MTSRQKRAFKAQYEKQLNEERNGAPVPPEIAARMTPEKKPEVLWQVVVSLGPTALPLRVGPQASQDFAEFFASTINAQVAAGREKTWRNAVAVPCLGVK